MEKIQTRILLSAHEAVNAIGHGHASKFNGLVMLPLKPHVYNYV